MHPGGEWFQYILSTRGEKPVELAVTYWGGDSACTFDILAHAELLVTETLNHAKPREYFEKRYRIPAKALSGAIHDCIAVKFFPSKARGLAVFMMFA